MIILLDTSVKHEVFGSLSEMELEFLETTLDLIEQDGDISNVLICLHHNPVKVQHGWSEEIGLRNRSDFFDVVEKFLLIFFLLRVQLLCQYRRQQLTL